MSFMRLVYITNSRIPTEKAHGIQVMKMCEAFSDAGAEVVLVVPDRQNPISEDPFLYYGVRKNFSIRYVSNIDTVFLGRLGFIFQSVSFAYSAWREVLKLSPDVVYGRDEYSLCAISVFTHFRCVYEVHMGRWNFIIKLLTTKAEKIVSISNGLKTFFVEHGVSSKKIVIAADAVDITDFSVPVSQQDAREKLSLPKDKKIVVYTGHLYDWKGADMLIELAKLLSKDTALVIVGGVQQDIDRYKKIAQGISTIVFVGKKPHAEIPLYLHAADVVILPNSGKFEISKLHTSPMKLFEYMVAQRPIVSSDLPSIREIVSDNEVYFAEADNAESFNQKINEAFGDTKTARSRVQSAYRLVCERYTWGMRAQQILSEIV